MAGRLPPWLGLDRTALARAVSGGLVLIGAGLGCARYAPAPLDPAGTAEAYASRRLDTPELREWLAAHGAAVEAGWTSADLALVALYYRPAVARARAAWRASRAAERTAGARPQPDLQSEVGYATSSAVFESRWLTTIGAIFTVELGGKRGARIVAARARSALAETDLEAAAWRATREVRTAAVELAAAEHRLADAATAAQRVAAFQARLERRYAEGTLGRADLAAIGSESADAEAAVLREGAAVTGARAALAVAAGVPPGALNSERVAPEAVPDCAAGSPDSLRRIALRSRPEIGHALAEYAVAEGDLRVAVSGAYPDLGVGPGYTWDQGIGRWSLLFGLPHLPLNGNRGPIAEATARRTEAATRFAERQAAVIDEVSAALAGCGVARAEVDGADSVVVAAVRRAEIARAAYDRGEIGLSGIEPLELEETRAGRAANEARLRLGAAGLALETAIGAWPPGTVHWPDPREDPARREEGTP